MEHDPASFMKLDFEALKARPPGRPQLYPWDLWLDGGAWRIDPETFPAKGGLESMRTMAYMAARDRGLRLRTRTEPGTGALLIRAVTVDEWANKRPIHAARVDSEAAQAVGL